MCAPVATRMAFMLLPPLPITRLIAFGGTDTFLERNGEFINLPESSDCPLKNYDACIKEYMFIYENKITFFSNYMRSLQISLRIILFSYLSIYLTFVQLPSILLRAFRFAWD